MRTILQLVIKQELQSKSGKDYILYKYMLDDGSVIDSLQECEPGEQVMVWYDHKWNKPKIRKWGKGGTGHNS